MNCCICQKPVVVVGVLYRINAKGTPGIYACRRHIGQTDAPTPDASLVELTELLAGA